MVYFLKEKGQPRVKIGYTASHEIILRRLANMRVLVPNGIEHVRVMDGDRSDEKRLHVLFAASWIRGEWFGITGDLQEYMETQTTLVDINNVPGLERKDVVYILKHLENSTGTPLSVYIKLMLFGRLSARKMTRLSAKTAIEIASTFPSPHNQEVLAYLGALGGREYAVSVGYHRLLQLWDFIRPRKLPARCLWTTPKSIWVDLS